MVTIGSKRRFRIAPANGHAAARFGRPAHREMVSLLGHRTGRRWVLVAELRYAAELLQAETVQPDWLYAPGDEPSLGVADTLT